MVKVKQRSSNFKTEQKLKFFRGTEGKGGKGRCCEDFKEVIWLHWRLVEKQQQKL